MSNERPDCSAYLCRDSRSEQRPHLPPSGNARLFRMERVSNGAEEDRWSVVATRCLGRHLVDDG